MQHQPFGQHEDCAGESKMQQRLTMHHVEAIAVFQSLRYYFGLRLFCHNVKLRNVRQHEKSYLQIYAFVQWHITCYIFRTLILEAVDRKDPPPSTALQHESAACCSALLLGQFPRTVFVENKKREKAILQHTSIAKTFVYALFCRVLLMQTVQPCCHVLQLSLQLGSVHLGIVWC